MLCALLRVAHIRFEPRTSAPRIQWNTADGVLPVVLVCAQLPARLLLTLLCIRGSQAFWNLEIAPGVWDERWPHPDPGASISYVHHMRARTYEPLLPWCCEYARTGFRPR